MKADDTAIYDVEDSKFECLKCGATKIVPMPVPALEMLELCRQFTEDHRDCEGSE